MGSLDLKMSTENAVNLKKYLKPYGCSPDVLQLSVQSRFYLNVWSRISSFR